MILVCFRPALRAHAELVEMMQLDFEITFANGERFHPTLWHYVKAGARTETMRHNADSARRFCR